MITRGVDYVIDPAKTAHRSVRIRRMALVEQHGGTHHGYFLASEGASHRGLALFTSPAWPPTSSKYRERFGVDPAFIAADRIRDDSGCVVRYDRSFMRPLLPHRAAD